MKDKYCTNTCVIIASNCLFCKQMFKLPKTVTYSVCGEWLELKGMAKLDSAVCNVSSRTSFIDLVGNRYFVFQSSSIATTTEKKQMLFINWLVHRKVKLSELVIKTSTLSKDVSARLSQIDFSKLNSLSLECDVWSALESGFNFLSNCTQLSNLNIYGGGMGSSSE